MTDLRHDLFAVRAEPGATEGEGSSGVNPYAAHGEATVEPVRSDPYAALRQDADEREANQFGLSSISSLSELLSPGADQERVTPPEPVLSEDVLVAAGLLEPADPVLEEPEVPAGAAKPSSEVSFSDFLSDGWEPAEEADLTEIFAGLETIETPADAGWRRGDDDVIGAGTTPSRSSRRSLRLRRRAA